MSDFMSILGDLKPEQAAWLEASLPAVLKDAVKQAVTLEKVFEEVEEKYHTIKPDVVEGLRSKFVLPNEESQGGNTDPTGLVFIGKTLHTGNVEG